MARAPSAYIARNAATARDLLPVVMTLQEHRQRTRTERSDHSGLTNCGDDMARALSAYIARNAAITQDLPSTHTLRQVSPRSPISVVLESRVVPEFLHTTPHMKYRQPAAVVRGTLPTTHFLEQLSGEMVSISSKKSGHGRFTYYPPAWSALRS